MSLNRNRIDKVLSYRGVESLLNLLCQNLILAPPCRIFFNMIHIFNRCKGIKAQTGKYFIPIIEGCLIVVNGMGPVPQILQIECNAFAGLFLQNRFIGIFTRSEKVQIHPCNTLKLCIGRSRSHRGNVQISGRKMLCQKTKQRNGILLYRIVFPESRIKKGFQLYHNNVGRRVFFNRICIFRNQLLLLQTFQLLLSVFIRPGNSCIKGRVSKTVGKSVILEGLTDIAKMHGNHLGKDCKI